MMFYLYKISFKKYYYIGVTSDMVTRKWQHHSGIVRLILALINKEEPTFKMIPAHRSLSELIYPLVKNSPTPEKDVLKYYTISVLRRSKTQDEIQKLESTYLKKSNKYNLNHYKDSFYKREIMIKEKLYVIRGNNYSEQPSVVKITYGNRYIIAKMKQQSAGLKRIEDAVNAFMRGGENNPNGLYTHLFKYIKREPHHKFSVKTLLFSDNAYELLKLEQEELDKGRNNKNFLNNQTEAYLPMYNEEKKMYGGWIPQVAVLNFNNWMKTRKKAKKSAV